MPPRPERFESDFKLLLETEQGSQPISVMNYNEFGLGFVDQSGLRQHRKSASAFWASFVKVQLFGRKKTAPDSSLIRL